MANGDNGQVLRVSVDRLMEAEAYRQSWRKKDGGGGKVKGMISIEQIISRFGDNGILIEFFRSRVKM